MNAESAHAVTFLVSSRRRPRRVALWVCPRCAGRHVSTTVRDVAVMRRRPPCDGAPVELHLEDVETVARSLAVTR